MRFSFAPIAAIALAILPHPVAGGEPPEKPEGKPTALRVGDPAPPLRVSKWLSGTEVKRFEPGKVYVVEFWATWCGPCIAVMPHLTALQTEYKDKGLTVVGVTAKDEKNSAAAVEAFVAQRGKRYAYTFAFCEDRTTYDAYMTAAGLQGIPSVFVVGPTGKIEFIGHSMELDLVIPKVLAGTWRGQPDIDQIRKDYGRFAGIMKKAQTDPAAALKEFAAFETDFPKVAAGYYYQIKKLQLLLLGKEFDAARELSESLIRSATELANPILVSGVRLMWSASFINPDKKHPELALKAAEAELKIEGDRDPAALFHVAEAHAFAGNTVKATEYGQKAVAEASGEERKEYEAALKKLLGK
ncbi:TlpA family protein disulfide reductase [Gemmata sp. G18]|uniref:TlpA family protein disulfide reductase n=1 Tax=Gemmata palustris TaxID=2822762 RepID=A0ABS5BJN9_9BACT|nr:TlpA disulfide reductase family protein [Gemmata palustris]MBP3953919.1 TlpA family protein disulfide reductase [Gemmata palustris]